MINKKDYKSSHISPWLTTGLQTTAFKESPTATLFLSDDLNALKKMVSSLKIASWRSDSFDENFDSVVVFDSELGPTCVLNIKDTSSDKAWPQLSGSPLSAAIRDKTGECFKALESTGAENLEIHVQTQTSGFIDWVAIGAEMSHYSFKGRKKTFKKIRILHNGKALTAKDLKEPISLAHSVNWARHLVNLPPNRLLPDQYAKLVKQLFQKVSSVKVEIWDDKKLTAEKCDLHLAVGRASSSSPQLVILKYRPQNASAQSKPIALVGKGITFDTGGLDLKPAGAMRWMKKDMGGSASVVGVMLYAAENKLPVKIDAYLALAENSVNSEAFRPGDLVQARNGKMIEIHNTDAEGRLVLADALDVAITRKGADKPKLIIDLATLTGAIKVALGAQIAGLFSNDESLGKELYESFTSVGDDAWPMPLYQKYRSQMNSPFADMTNSVDGFGGAVTAALFLESFVDKLPWAHLDIYAWKDSADGACLETGGNGQGVQGLVQWLKERTQTATKKSSRSKSRKKT